MILPALTEAKHGLYRPIKYSLFPPLGLATLAGYLEDDDEVIIEDEHVAPIDLNDAPDLVVIQVYITSAYRSYAVADHYRKRGTHVCLGGLHVTSLPEEAARHADTVFLGPGEDTWPEFLGDFRGGRPKPRYASTTRSLANVPRIRRDLIRRELYLVPNSIVVSRGCPHRCDFCYKEAFFAGGKSFYTQTVDRTLAEIDGLPGRHLYFLDDHLLGDARFAADLFDGMKGMGRLWQAAATVSSLSRPGLLERAATAGLRSVFVGFESLRPTNLRTHDKVQNLDRDYARAIARCRDLDVMINGSFVFGMDDDDVSVFDDTVDWAVQNGIETATFHVLTPYPSTELYRRMAAQQRLLHSQWDRYDTRQAVFQPARMTTTQLEDGYRRAYRDFYSWRNIATSASSKPVLSRRLRHVAYAAGWKKFEGVWNAAIRLKQLTQIRPALEGVLSGLGYVRPRPRHDQPPTVAPDQSAASASEADVPARVWALEPDRGVAQQNASRLV